MCYTAESLTLKSLKYALHRGDLNYAEELQRKLDEMRINQTPKYNVSGFAHPPLLVFTNLQPYTPQLFTWGLIPAWTKNLSEAKKFWNNTLNARGETIFEKPSFKNSAKNKRCLIYLDAFYEHHHLNKKTYPYRIAFKSGEPMVVAGLWEEWTDRESGEIINTCTIVTTVGNPLMAKIHNNPKAEMGPRMPVILNKHKQDNWLMDCQNEQDKALLEALISPYNEEELQAYTVKPLLGKAAIGNVPDCELEFTYPELAHHLR